MIESNLKYAPIVVFAFNRLNSLKATIESLLENEEASLSDLFVFVDGPRLYRIGEVSKVNEVKEFVKNISGFKSVTYSFSDTNKGLGPSIIAGVTEIINRYGFAIVLEDDLTLSTNFLAYMNRGLMLYEKESRVFSICGYSNCVNKPSSYKFDSYFCVRSSSWGWATWKDRWNCVDWDLNDWETVKQNKSKFNKWGGSDCFGMLSDWKKGKNKSWAIRFCYSQFVTDKLALFPFISKVNNNGFNDDGTNCRGYNRFKNYFDNKGAKDFKFPDMIFIIESIRKDVLGYHSLKIRLWSRLMNIFY